MKYTTSSSTVSTTSATPEVTVALQGTIETFALPDVLRLLASTKKTGELRVTGDRGSGRLAIADGAIVGSEAANAPHVEGAVDVVFELLRFETGEFVFEDGPASGTDAPAEVEPVLADAEKLLAEWREIEAVVPSSAAWVALAADLPDDEVTIDRDRWKAIVAVGSGTTVAALGDLLSLGELPVARLVKELSEAKLVELGEAPADAAPASTPLEGAADAPAEVPEAESGPAFGSTFEPAAPTVDEPGSLTTEPAPVADPEPTSFDAAPSFVDEERFDPNGLVIEEPTVTPEGPSEPPAPAPEASPGEAAEIARQLANLSPKAARAVAAAAKATTEEEREAALAEVEEGDDQINRELLLKFLGTVN